LQYLKLGIYSPDAAAQYRSTIFPA
jgi:hypothetical protein